MDSRLSDHALLPLALVALLLAGCATTEPDQPASPAPPSETVDGSSDASADPTTRPDELPLLDELLAHPDGLSYLLIGSPPAIGAETDLLVWDPEYCNDPDLSPGGDPGRWVSVYPESAGRSYSASVVDDAVVRIDIVSESITTAEGIGIGSTVDELIAAYPELESTGTRFAFTDVYVLTGPSGQLSFEAAWDTGDGYWQPEQLGVIQLLRVEEAGTGATTVAASDNVAGGCL